MLKQEEFGQMRKSLTDTLVTVQSLQIPPTDGARIAWTFYWDVLPLRASKCLSFDDL